MRSESLYFVVIIACAAIFITVYTILAYYRVHAMKLGVDTGVYLQTLLNFAHSGSTFNFGQNRPKMSLHDSWAVIVIFAPIVAAIPRVETLLVAGVVAVAAASIPLYFLGRTCGLSGPASAAISAAYLICPTTHGLAFGNFTEADLIPLFAFSLAIAVRRKSFIGSLIFAQLLTGIKEDESLFLIWFGAAFLIWYDRRSGLGLILIGLFNFVGYEIYQRGTGYPAHNPSYGLSDHHVLQHVGFLAEILAPFAFLPLRLGWRLLLGVPFVAEITLNKPWLGQELARGGSHYTTPLLTIIAIGTVFAVRERPTTARFLVPAALVMMIFFNVTVFRIGRHEYPPAWGRYCEAERAASDGRYHMYGLDKEDVFAVEAANPNVHLEKSGKQIDSPPWWSGNNIPTPAPTFSSCEMLSH
jgi:uncharacterized membrane protein